jgi:hypothetical protein
VRKIHKETLKYTCSLLLVENGDVGRIHLARLQYQELSTKAVAVIREPNGHLKKINGSCGRGEAVKGIYT